MRRKLFTTKEHLHLNLKKKWFAMIYSGAKKEEYRDLSTYWEARFSKLFPKRGKGVVFEPIVETIIFSNGYAKDRRQFEIELKGIYKGPGEEAWGAKKGKRYFVLQLGDVIQSNILE